MEPFQSTKSHRIRLFLSICTFGLLAPVLVSFRKEQISQDLLSTESNQNNELMINQKEQERKEVKSQINKRYMFYIEFIFLLR